MSRFKLIVHNSRFKGPRVVWNGDDLPLSQLTAIRTMRDPYLELQYDDGEKVHVFEIKVGSLGLSGVRHARSANATIEAWPFLGVGSASRDHDESQKAVNE